MLINKMNCIRYGKTLGYCLLILCVMLAIGGCSKNSRRGAMTVDSQQSKDNRHASSPLGGSRNHLTAAHLENQEFPEVSDIHEGQDVEYKDTEVVEGPLGDETWSHGDLPLQDWEQGIFQDGEYLDARQRAEYRTEDSGVRDIYFQFNSWRLTSEAKDTLAKNAEWLKGHTREEVTIEGHCDERGTQAYNYALGAKRANMAKNYLISLGVPPQRIKSTSYGKDKPQCRQYTEGCFQDNRRAHMIIGIEVVSRGTQSAMLRAVPEN